MAEAMTSKEFSENKTVKESMAQMTDIIEADSEAMKLIEAARTVEDMWEVTKRFVKLGFEEFKNFFRNTVDYFSSPKAELPDEVLDNVAGGWSLTGLFSNIAKKTACVVACVACAAGFVTSLALGVVAATVAGPVGMIAGCGFAAVGMVGCSAAFSYCYNELKNS